MQTKRGFGIDQVELWIEEADLASLALDLELHGVARQEAIDLPNVGDHILQFDGV